MGPYYYAGESTKLVFLGPGGFGGGKLITKESKKFCFSKGGGAPNLHNVAGNKSRIGDDNESVF